MGKPIPAIAVTGGVACGKSTLGRLLEERGADVIDTDTIVHRLQMPQGKVSEAIRREFGDQFLLPEGSVDRPRLAAVVFTDRVQREKLNRIVHPLVREELRQWRTAPTPAWAKVALIPLLFESGWGRDWDLTVCVVCSEDRQRARARARGWSDEETDRRINAQWPTRKKMELADRIIDNEGEIPQLAEAADELKKEFLKN